MNQTNALEAIMMRCMKRREYKAEKLPDDAIKILDCEGFADHRAVEYSEGVPIRVVALGSKSQTESVASLINSALDAFIADNELLGD
jgi:hypothetical protein